jgi:DNA-binding transcriptional LysR family regulator
LGIALVPDATLVDRMETGCLVTVLPDQIGSDTTVSVAYPDRQFLQPQVRAFIDFSVGWFADKGVAMARFRTCPSKGGT